MIKKIIVTSILASFIATGVVSAQTTGDVMIKKEAPTVNTTTNRDGITELQSALIEGGYLTITSTTKKGVFGPQTRAALIKFQKANGLPATGNFGALTKAKLADKKSMMKKEDSAMKRGEDAMMKKEDGVMTRKGDVMVKKDGEVMIKKEDTAVMKKSVGMYAPYSVDKLALAKDNKVIIFFHAAWCPTCRALDAEITSKGVKDGYIILKADYDSSKELKAKYGVTIQHTLVRVGASGDALGKWSGGDLASIYSKAN